MQLRRHAAVECALGGGMGENRCNWRLGVASDSLLDLCAHHFVCRHRFTVIIRLKLPGDGKTVSAVQGLCRAVGFGDIKKGRRFGLCQQEFKQAAAKAFTAGQRVDKQGADLLSGNRQLNTSRSDTHGQILRPEIHG